MKILVLVGPSCAGKSTAGKILEEELDYLHIEASDHLKAIHSKSNSSLDYYDFAMDIIAKNPSTVPNSIIKFFDLQVNHANIVLTGFRSPLEFLALKNLLHSSTYLSLVHISSSVRARECRRQSRGVSTTHRNLGIAARDKVDRTLGVDGFRQVPGTVAIENNGSFAEFKTKILTLGIKIKGMKF